MRSGSLSLWAAALIAGLALAGCDDDGGGLTELEPMADGGASADASTGAADDAGPGADDAGAPPGDAGVEPEPPADIVVERLDFEGITLTDGLSEMQTIELPDDVLSLTLIVLGSGLSLHVVQHLEGPDGTILVAENPPGYRPAPRDRFLGPFPGPFNSPNRSASSSTAVSALLAPNNPGVQVTGGTWTFQIAAVDGQGRPASGEADVVAFVKRGPAPQTRGSFDLHLHFTGARGWTAATAPTDPDFQRALERMRGFYEDVGIELGEVTYTDIDASYRTVDATAQGPLAPINLMFAQSNYDTGVSLFFVDRLTSPFGDNVVGGIAGGAPGPILLRNTPRSGVAVATALDPDPDAIGHIMGHETGHYLGLYHTQETVGPVDQIDDTPTGGAGNTNLMFPTVTAGEASLSDGQGWVLHRNPGIVPQ